MSIKRILTMAGLAIVAWYGVNWYVGYQELRSAASCAREIDMPSQQKAAKSDEQARVYAGRLLDCMEGKLGFPASLFFDKQKALATLKRKGSTDNLKPGNT
jgi:hypothetical protein